MNQLPDIEIANSHSFAELACCIRDFIGWHEKNNERVHEDDLVQLNKLADLLNSKRKNIEKALGEAPLISEEPKKPILPKKGAKRKVVLANYYRKHQEWLALKRSVADWIYKEVYLQREINDETRIYEGRKSDIIRLINRAGWPSITIMNWYILPPGLWPKTDEEVERVLPRNYGIGYCPERILHAESLNPFEIGRGTGEFERYFCFRYKFTSKVLLESADDGNAAYILSGNWKSLSRKTKYELNNYHSSEIQRVLHREDSPWRRIIKTALGGK